jgi:RNA polymerase sigma-70 factor (ECF subfamily)
MKMNWNEIYSREAPALYSYLLAQGCPFSEAEDRIHEVFTAALSAGTRVANPRAYLFRAVRNAMARAAQRRTPMSELPDIVDPGPAPAEGEAVNTALSALPGEQREVVVLRIWHGMGFREIGEALDIPRDTAASRWRYGIEKLRTLLRKDEVSHGE